MREITDQMRETLDQMKAAMENVLLHCAMPESDARSRWQLVADADVIINAYDEATDGAA